MGEHSFSPNCRPYGVCNEFEGKTQEVNKEEKVRTIQQICTSVAISDSGADNGRRSFVVTSYCTGHRKRDNKRKPKKNLQTFKGVAYANNINTLRNILNDEIEDRRKNAYYNRINGNLEQVKDTPIISNLKQEGEYIETTYPNAIADKIKYLKSFCDNIKIKTKDSVNLESSIGNISNISSDIKSGKIVLGGSPEKIQNVIAQAVTDCICYSDCHGFSVCECYGYCNCNY